MKILFLIVLATLTVPADLLAREWTSADGSRTFQGELISFENDKVTVRRSDGKQLVFAIGLLSEADQKFINSGEATKSSKSASGSVTLPLSDSKIEQLLEEAVKKGLLYNPKPESDLLYKVIGFTADGLQMKFESEPYSGWVKSMWEEQLEALYQMKNGKRHGAYAAWHENGQKKLEATYKANEEDGPYTEWHKNGQKQFEKIYKDGEMVSGKYWNSKGEPVATAGETHK